MGRKKKVEEPKEGLVGLTPLVVAIPPEILPTSSNGAAVVEDKVLLASIRDDARKWAIECGLKGELMLNGPEKVDYPQHGYGYCATIKEQDGKQRLGSARYTSAGVRSYWSIDGIVTG